MASASSVSRELDEALDELCQQLRIAWHDGDFGGIKRNVSAIRVILQGVEEVVKDRLWRNSDPEYRA